MKKSLFLKSIILASVLFFPISTFANTTNNIPPGYFQKGANGEFVKDIQNILKNDSLIYPQGLVTGFYGPATEQAVKNLQARYGLPQTGVIDSETIQILFPNNVQLNVITPNGGEVWNKENNNTILWSVTVGPIIADGRELAPSASSKPESVSKPLIAPFFKKASIDLVKDSDPNFIYHIATVDLYQTQYAWKAPNRVPNSSDYRVKISVGGNVPCLYRMPDDNDFITNKENCPMWYPNYSYSDTSDNVFSITGNTVPDDTVVKLKEILKQMQQIINNLQSQLNLISQLVLTL
ncbi:MAG: peptidoglycan-binding protein [Candidatus Staskawiczbacteria bacterium]|nr:peptidoglycan-binding protein [Candidatus Staskawiczbacteria bacterium]MBI3337493.1 peptidoglycan-binding protein [Candidatus Staskawiczbacteria bacterium]